MENCKGDDVRAAAVKVLTGTGRAVTVKGPVQRLFPFEVQEAVTKDEPLSEEKGQNVVRRTRREAALSADCIR